MKIKAETLPHSWQLAEWPRTVAPGNVNAAKHWIRVNRQELIECGALARVGRNLIVLGEGYALFLSRKLKNVEGFVSGPNKSNGINS